MAKVTDEKAYSILTLERQQKFTKKFNRCTSPILVRGLLVTAGVKIRRPPFSWCGMRSKNFRQSNAKSRFMSLRLTRWSKRL